MSKAKLDRTIDEVVREHVEQVLSRYHPTEAARVLGISGQTLWRMRKKWGLPFRDEHPRLVGGKQ